jgi:hypothetical protein
MLIIIHLSNLIIVLLSQCIALKDHVRQLARHGPTLFPPLSPRRSQTRHSFDRTSAKHTLITAKDRVVITYHFPVAALTNPPDLIPSITRLPRLHQKLNGVNRGGYVQRHYLVSCRVRQPPLILSYQLNFQPMDCPRSIS